MRITKAGALGVVGFVAYIAVRQIARHVSFPTEHAVHVYEMAAAVSAGLVATVSLWIALKPADVRVSSLGRTLLAPVLGVLAGFAMWVSFGHPPVPLSGHPLAFSLLPFVIGLTSSALDPRRFWLGPTGFVVGVTLYPAIHHTLTLPFAREVLANVVPPVVVGAAVPVIAAELGRHAVITRSRLVAELAAVTLAVGGFFSLTQPAGCSADHSVVPSTSKHPEARRAIAATLLSKNVAVTVVRAASRGRAIEIDQRVDGCDYRTPYSVRVGHLVYERETSDSPVFTRRDDLPSGFDDPLRDLRYVLLEEIDHIHGANGRYKFDSGERSTGVVQVGIVGTMTIRGGLVREFVEPLRGLGSETYTFRYHQQFAPITPPPERLVRGG